MIEVDDWEINFKRTIVWKNTYYRNNKIGGLKNIRCFPTHSVTGHNPIHFCGRSIEVALSTRKPLLPTIPFKLVADFSLEDDPALSVGSTISKRDLEMDCHPKTNRKASCRFFISDVKRVKMSTVTFIINQERKGWHYSWVAKKNKQRLMHTFNSYLLHENGDTYECVAMIRSPPFYIMCRRGMANAIYAMESENVFRVHRPIPVPAYDPLSRHSSVPFRNLSKSLNEYSAPSCPEVEISANHIFRPFVVERQAALPPPSRIPFSSGH